jgi:hypothetical protein
MKLKSEIIFEVFQNTVSLNLDWTPSNYYKKCCSRYDVLTILLAYLRSSCTYGFASRVVMCTE